MTFSNGDLSDSYSPLQYQRLPDLNRNVLMTPDNKVIYLSIPKCGCSSLKYFLRRNYGEDETKLENIQSIHDMDDSSIINYELLTLISSLKDFLYTNKVFLFSVVRCPKERILSAYLNKFKLNIKETKNKQRHVDFTRQLFGYKINNEDLIQKITNLSFKNFLEIISTQSHLEMNEHWRPMIYQLLGFPIEKINLYTLSRLDNLKNDLEKFLSKELIFKTTVKRGGHSTSSGRFLEEYYSEDVLSIFNSIYEKDILLYESLVN